MLNCLCEVALARVLMSTSCNMYRILAIDEEVGSESTKGTGNKVLIATPVTYVIEAPFSPTPTSDAV